MANLLNIIQSQLSGDVLSKISSVVGGNSSVVQTGMTSMLPNIIKGIIQKGSTSTGASSIMNLIKNNGIGGSTFDNISSMLDGGDKTTGLLDKGANINKALFEDSAESISKVSGMNAQSSTKLFNIATPFIMGNLAKVIDKEGLDANGFSTYLKSQDNFVKVPDVTPELSEAKNGGMGLLKLLIPIAILAAIAYWFLTKDKGTTSGTTPQPAKSEKAVTTQTKAPQAAATHTHADGTVHQGATHGGSTTTSQSNETSTTTKGSNIKQSVIKDMNEFGGETSNVTSEAFKSIFSALFRKKSEGVNVGNYKLNNISFNSGTHTIDNYSKNEVTGLAEALIANPNTSIKVQVSTNESTDDNENKPISTKRSKIVMDMLVKLGVNKNQISHDGIGAGTVARSMKDKVEIIVVQ